MELRLKRIIPKGILNQWKTAKDNPLVWLQDAIAQGYELNYLNLSKDFDALKPLLDDPKEQDDLKVVRALAWCACLAVHQPAKDTDVITRVLTGLGSSENPPQNQKDWQRNPPPFIIGRSGWAMDCIRLFGGKDVGQNRSLHLPIALVDEETSQPENGEVEQIKSTGLIATLVLELRGVGGQIFQHPCDSLTTYPQTDFIAAMEDAWEAAKSLAKRDGKDYNFDARWRVLDKNGEPIKFIKGRSASAAAALGVYHLLRGTRPDDGIIVLAQVDAEDLAQLKGVSKIREKTAAIIKYVGKHSGFDSIVVANNQDAQEAHAALGHASRIRVVNLQPPTLETLQEVRSQKVEAVIDYLDSLAKEMAELPAYYPPRLRSPESGKTLFDELRQKVRVVEDRSAFHDYLAKMHEQMRAQGLQVDPRAYANAENDERSKIKMPAPPVEWNEEAGKRFKRAVILADPGLGKTWILKYEARRIANDSAQRLRDHLATLDEIALPIFTRLSDIHQTNVAVEDALVSFAEKRCKAKYHSPEFRQVVRDKLNSENCVVLLDAWDEVLENRKSLGDRLSEFARAFTQPRLLMTSRIVGYGASPIPDMKEVEIVAFDTPQIKAFAEVWYGEATDLRERFLEMLNQNLQVQGLARIPLIMALMCCVYEKDTTSFPTRRVELYEQCLWGLLRDWKEEKQKEEISEIDVQGMLFRLAGAALALHKAKKEVFSETDLAAALGFDLKKEKQAKKAKEFIEALKRDGILIKSGEHQGQRQFLFLHRAFHEYLTAYALSEQANEKGWQAIGEMIDKKSWLAEWEEVVILLAGKLNDPVALLQMLSDPKTDDYFRHRLCLAAKCLPELSADGHNLLWNAIRR